MSTIVEELIAVLGYEIKGQDRLDKFNRSLNQTQKGTKSRVAATQKLGDAEKRNFRQTMKSEKAIARQRKALNGGNAKAAAAGGLMGARGIGSFVPAASVASFAGAGLVTQSAFTDFAAFQREMIRIGIDAEATMEEIANATSLVEGVAIDVALPRSVALEALKTVTAAGHSLGDAMDLLPSILATTQASGAAATDIANSLIKSSSALSIPFARSQEVFDLLVTGGQSGSFELRDMAAFLPELVNLFASLGYESEDGLRTLIALLQAVREDTGSASGAATQLRNVFAKINSEETGNRFKEFGIDLRKELTAARQAGEDVIDTFIELSEKALDGDLTKLPLLFRDQELLLGMQSLITSKQSFDQHFSNVDPVKTSGAVMKNLNLILDDSQSKIDRLSANWDRLMRNFGEKSSIFINPALEGINEQFDLNRTLDELIDEQKKIDADNGVERPWYEIGTQNIQRRAAERILDTQGIESFNQLPIQQVLKNEILNARGVDLPLNQMSNTEAIARNLQTLNADNVMLNVQRDLSASGGVNNQASNTNNINIEQNVTQATDAPGEAAKATADAIGRTLPNRVGLQIEPVSP